MIQLIAALQPAIVFVENVEPDRHTASAAILRCWLRDAGYAVVESVLNARDFGSLESRGRWFLVAHPPQVPLALGEVTPMTPPQQACLADVLEVVPADDPRFRQVGYLKTKADRDRGKGSGFGMQVLTPECRSVPVLRRGYHKGGSTDPRLLHPVDASRSRLLTAVEHARIKGIDPAMLQGASETLAHQVCGQ